MVMKLRPVTARRIALCSLAVALGAGWPAGKVVAQPVAFDGPELPLSTGFVSDSRSPGLVPGPDGGFFAAWHGALPDGPPGAHYRGFDAAGAPRGETRRARSTSPVFGRHRGQPVIAGDPAAGFAILQWTSAGNDAVLEMGLYRPSGGLRSGPFLLGEPVAEDQPAAAALGGPAPHLVVVRGQDDASRAVSPSHLFARRFNPSGAEAGGEIPVSGEVDRLLEAAVAMGPGGGFAVVWTEEDEVGPPRLLARGFGPGDQPLGPPEPVSPFPGVHRSVAVTPGPGDGFTVWFLATPPGGDPTLWRREIAPDGRPRGEATEVAGGLQPFGTGGVDAAADGAGNALVAWSAPGELDTLTEVFARGYGPDGLPAGPPFRVNTGVAGTQEAPAVTAAAPTRFVVAWRSEEDFDAPAEIRGQLLRVDGRRPGGDERAPVPLTSDRVACDEARLRGLLERLTVEERVDLDPPRQVGTVLSFTGSGDFAGVTYTVAGLGIGRHRELAFSTNPEETPLLRNPERPPLASVSLARNPPSSDLVPAGASGELRLVLDPTLQGGPPPPVEALLAIDNVGHDGAGSAGTPASARPGRGIEALVAPCHDLFAEDDVQVFRVLQRILHAEGPSGARAFETAVYRGEEPGLFRIDVYPLGARGESLGRLAAELTVEWTPDGRLWTGELRLRPRCGDGLVRGCTSVARPVALALVAPTFEPPSSPPASVRLEASGGVDPPLERRFAWRDLLGGTTWLGTP